MTNLLIIDAQGGGLGRQLIAIIKKECQNIKITAVGTNANATMTMLKAGADEAATGENSVIVACRSADIIIGPIGIVIADSMIGEITPRMAVAVAQSSAKRILIPFSHCDNYIAGIADKSMSVLIHDAIVELKKNL